LLDFLNIKFNIKNLTTSNIKYKILDSKYLNISGNIFIQSANGVYFNFCDNNKIKDCIIKIVTEENFLEINETMQTCEIQSRKNKINLDYKYEHISDNSKAYVKKGKFIKNIDINLNTIHQSLDIHKKLFQIMKRVYKENNINKKYIIT
jgi:parallel beta-helix repeat protein